MVVGGAAEAEVKRLLAVVRLRLRSWKGNSDCKPAKEHESVKRTKKKVNKNTLTNMTNRLLSGGMMAFFLQNVLKSHCCVSNIKRYCFKAKDITAKMIMVVTLQKANNHTGTARWHENISVWIHLRLAQG